LEDITATESGKIWEEDQRHAEGTALSASDMAFIRRISPPAAE
jgi:hypothetical protein